MERGREQVRVEKIIEVRDARNLYQSSIGGDGGGERLGKMVSC